MRAEVLAMALSGIVAGACLGAATDVDENTEKEWLNHTLPLPHEITVEKANRVAPGDIGIRLAANAGAIERNAAAQLRQMLKETQAAVAAITAARATRLDLQGRPGRL